MRLWIARDKNGGLYLHFDKPTTDSGKYYFTSTRAAVISRELFPEVTFENSPQQVEIRLVDAKMNRDFCESPFFESTPVIIFTSGGESDDWFHRNCDKCIKNDICELQNAMLNSSSDFYCQIPLNIAKRIGIDYNPLYQQGSVYSQCREYKKGDEPF